MTYMKIRILVRNSNVKGSVVVMTYLDGNSIPKKKDLDENKLRLL